MSASRNVQLDGLRGIAVLYVLLSHTSGRGQELLFLNFHGIGKIGVYLFFVLSAFLLTIIILKEGVDFKYGKYLKKRFYRIAPLYYLVLTLVIVTQGVAGINTKSLWLDDSLISIFKHFLFIKGDSIFWTIPAEFMFYFLLPFIVLYIVKYEKTTTWLLASALTFFLLFLLYNYFGIGVAPKIIEIAGNTQYFECFLIGVFFAVLQFNHVNDSNNGRLGYYLIKLANKRIILFLWVMLLFVSLIISKTSIPIVGEEAHNYLFHLRSLSFLYAIIFALTLVYLSNNTSRVFSNKILVYIGKVGFSAYLLHLPIIYIVNYYFINNLASSGKFVISMGIIFLLCNFTYKYIELPFIRRAKS